MLILFLSCGHFKYLQLPLYFDIIKPSDIIKLSIKIMSNKRIILFILCKLKKHNLIIKRIKDLLKNCLKEKLRKNSRKIFWHSPTYIKCKLFPMHKIKIPPLWYCFLCTGSLPYGWGEGLATRRPLLRGEHLA